MDDPIHVLVAEDNSKQARQARLLFESKGYQVTMARDGREAFEQLKADRPEIIVSDIVMPEMDGYELCRAVRSRPEFADLPIILLTSLSDPEDVIAALQCGADYFVTKPYKEEFLLYRVQAALRNAEFKRSRGSRGGRVISYADKEFEVRSEPSQIVNLLISTYENAVGQKLDLQTANEGLQLAQRQLTKKNSELKQLNEEKNRFLGMAAHDLRNPIGTVLGFCSLLLHDLLGPLTEEQRKVIERMFRGAKFMRDMLEDLLDVSKIESGKLELKLSTYDLLEQVEENVALNRMLSEKKGISITVDCRAEIPPITADAGKIEQVLNNLVTNAIKYSERETGITVEISRMNGEVLLAVRDRGQGIRSEELSKVFQPFGKTSTQATAGEKSTGLGLAIVKKIVEGHGGQIWVESVFGEGSTFYFTLPMEAKVEVVEQMADSVTFEL